MFSGGIEKELTMGYLDYLYFKRFNSLVINDTIGKTLPQKNFN